MVATGCMVHKRGGGQGCSMQQWWQWMGATDAGQGSCSINKFLSELRAEASRLEVGESSGELMVGMHC